MKISEIFKSFQGEGRLAGVPSVFVRTSVCNLRCVWCDTRYTSWEPEWQERDVATVLSEVRRLAASDVRHIVVTGGEPMLEDTDLVRLCAGLSSDGMHVTIETNATIFIPGLSASLISMSPKLRNSTPVAHGSIAESHEALRLNDGVIRNFLDAYKSPPDMDCQVKFVVEEEADLEEIGLLERRIPIPAEKILLMPQSIEPADLERKSRWLQPLAARRGYGFSPRLHIARYGNRRGV